jgi:hypothetical protein
VEMLEANIPQCNKPLRNDGQLAVRQIDGSQLRVRNPIACDIGALRQTKVRCWKTFASVALDTVTGNTTLLATVIREV